jgi:hypothetical protein
MEGPSSVAFARTEFERMRAELSREVKCLRRRVAAFEDSTAVERRCGAKTKAWNRCIPPTRHLLHQLPD